MILIAGYVIATWILGFADAASLVARSDGAHGLTSLELALLSIFSLGLSPIVYATFLCAGTLFLALLSLLPVRSARTSAIILSLPLALCAGAVAFTARRMPMISGTPVLWNVARVAVLAAPLAVIGLASYLARNDRPRWHTRALLIALALGLAAFTRVFGLTETVIARIPGTAFSFVAIVSLVGYLLSGIERPGRLAGALVLGTALAGVYVGVLPVARTVRAEAIVAHKTLLLQALFFTELALFSSPPGLPECTAPPEPTPAPAPSTSHSVLIVTLDALRADHMAAYGYDRVTMPNIEALLREAVVFETAYAAAPGTAGSFTAMWTGSSAYSMRALERWPKTLLQRLRELGYRVLGTDVTAVVRKAAPGFPPGRLFDARISYLDRAHKQVDALLAELRETRGPFLAFAHFKETHDEGARRYVPAVFPERRLSRYDDAIFEIDRHIGRLLEALRASGRYDDTVVVFSSDHGEFFGEHTRLHHGSLLYEPVVRVPFAIKLPGVAARREAAFVSGFDVSPTVFRAATGAAWPVPVLGRDVLSEIAAGRHERTVFMENVSQQGVRRVVAVRKGPYKYITLRGTRIEELFDLTRDPGELDNVAGEELETLAAMRGELDAVLRAQGCEVRALREQRYR